MEEGNSPLIRALIEKYISASQLQTAPAIASGENDSQQAQVSQVRPWVRYWARTLDLLLFSFVVGFALAILAPTVLQTNNVFITFFIMQGWVFQESILLSTWGTTPGKWLFRIKLRDKNGKKLNLSGALGRSFSVWLKGYGLGIPLISLITLLTARSRLKKVGITTWDEEGGFVMTHYKIGAIRNTVAALFLIGIFLLVGLANTPENTQSPELPLEEKAESPTLGKELRRSALDLALEEVALKQRLQKRISLECRNTPIEDALRMIAADFDIIKSPSVTGYVTASLTNVSVEEALNGIFPALGYGWYVSGENTIRVAPMDEIIGLNRSIAYNLPTTPTPQPGQVSGILWSEDNPSAIIGTIIVHEGDTISGVKVVKIRKGAVEFEKNGKNWMQGVGETPASYWTGSVTLETKRASLTADANDAQSFFDKGLKELWQENWSAALTYFQKAKEKDSQNADVWFYLGYCYDELGRWQDAIESYKQAIRIKPDYALAHYNLGVAYDKLGRYQDAIESSKQAIRIKPDYAEAHYNLGYCYGSLGRWQDAIESFKQAIRIKPDYAEAHCYLGVAYGKLGHWQEAMEPYKQAIRIKPDYAEAHYNLGYCYDELGRYQDAIESYKQAIRIKPDAEAHFNLGITYDKLGRYQDAIESYKQAIRIKPDCAEAHYNLGNAYLLVGDKSSALKEYKILKTLDTEQANRLFNLIYK
jgi:tetratricopeptide (TPR) repeat protein/uncharacterized RDD family membrane protein YckC